MARISACAHCGGHLAFDPDSGALLCGHCRVVTPLPAAGSAVVEPWRYELWADADRASGATIGSTSSCDGCGASTVLAADHTSGVCPYCKRAFVSDGRSSRALRPQAVFPLAVSRDRAGGALSAWLGSRWFAPNDLRSLARADTFTAIYVPAWSFTADASTRYEGKRGDDRTEWRDVSSTDSSGNTTTSREASTVTDWRRVRGQVLQHFEDVVVPASATITLDEERALRPFDITNAVPYQPAYVLGCACEEYSVTLAQGWVKAQDAVDEAIERAVKDDIGGDHQRISSRTTGWSAVLFLQLLLPIWVAVYTYKGQTYRALVNGRTAEVIGRHPRSPVKIALAALVATILLVVAVAIYQIRR